MQSQETSDTERVNYIVPKRLRAAVRQGAKQELMTESELVRRALVDKLRAIGIDPGAPL